MTIPYGNSEYVVTGAPRIVKGKVIIGNGGAEFHNVRGYVTAYDAETGDQAWRFYIVPGDPAQPFESKAMEMAAKTWAGEWWKYGGGGNAWDSFSYDPEANLVYIGTGNGAPWSHHWRSKGEGDNLFLNSIVAVNADTGEYVWHYQTVPGDNWDYTSTMTMTLADLVIDGQPRKVLMQAPKNGFFYVIDRLTGRAHLGGEDHRARHLGLPRRLEDRPSRGVVDRALRHDWRLDLSGASRGPQLAPDGVQSPHRVSSTSRGRTTSRSIASPPSTCRSSGRTSTGLVRGPGSVPAPPAPQPAGFLIARDPTTQRDRWRIELPTFWNGGVLVTASDVLFSGRRSGALVAHDARTGDGSMGERPSRPRRPRRSRSSSTVVRYVTVLSSAPEGAQGVAGRVQTFVLNR